jgi:TolB-like protein/DNA-binding winged helix-turn-helix (wHTH) protein/Tfp pilus assembly protein PilF
MLFRDGERLALTPKAIEILTLFVEAQGSPVTKDELLQKVWADAIVEEGTLTSHISVLRKALGVEEYIETIPKRGYRFAAPVRIIENELAQASAVAVRAKRSALNNRWAKMGAVAVLAIVVLLSLGYFPAKRFLLRPERSSGKQMIAVLPFQNLTGDPAQEFVSDGLTEEMIARLAMLNPEQLGVIARTSAMSYKGSSKRVDQIGQELGVQYVLDGSVRRWGDRARISVQLIEAHTQTHIWAGNYESDIGDILKLQRDVAQAVAQKVSVTLNPKSQLMAVSLVDPQVYEHCLRGRHEWNKRTQAGLNKAIIYFQQAINRDPNYAPAYAGLAETYAVLPYFSETPGDQAAAKASTAAERALQLDETLADAHGVLGFTKTIHLDLGGAEREYKRALELNPNNATVHHWYSFVLWNMGRRREALAELESARQLDPLSMVINTDEAAILCADHQTDQAIALLQKAIELDPNFADAHRTLAIAYSEKGLDSQAISEARRGLALDPNVSEQTTLGYVYGVAGKMEQAREILAELRKRSVSQFYLSFVYIGLGEKDEALLCLERTYRERSFMLSNVATQAMFDPLRSDPRFQDLQRRITNMMLSMDSHQEISKY